MTWEPIATAPKDGTRIDIWAKCWLADRDRFVARRFTDCFWTKGDSMTNRREGWSNVDTSHYATHWMPITPGPAP